MAAEVSSCPLSSPVIDGGALRLVGAEDAAAGPRLLLHPRHWASAEGAPGVGLDPVFLQACVGTPRRLPAGCLQLLAATPDLARQLTALAEHGPLYLPAPLQLILAWGGRVLVDPAATRRWPALGRLLIGWLRLVERQPLPAVAAPRRRQLADARRQLAADLARPAPLETLEQQLGLSRSTLNRWFRAQLGMTVNRYRRELRLRQAAARLLEGEPSCGRLARELGYGSASQFTQDFATLYGWPPSRLWTVIAAALELDDPRALALPAVTGAAA